MESVVFLFASVTYAMKAKRILSEAGIPSRLIKSEGGDSVSGCRHGLEVAPEDFRTVCRLLKENHFSYEIQRR